MTIAEAREKCKSFVAKAPRDILIISVLVLASSLSFGLGLLAGLDARPASDSVLETSVSQVPTSEVGAPTGSVSVVASKNGTKYYLPNCAGVDRISDANKVWFASPAAASNAGYAPAANCPGL